MGFEEKHEYLIKYFKRENELQRDLFWVNIQQYCLKSPVKMIGKLFEICNGQSENMTNEYILLVNLLYKIVKDDNKG